MKKLFLLAAMLCMVLPLFATHVPAEQAKNIATAWYMHAAGTGMQPGIASISEMKTGTLTTYYVFHFSPQGFVIVAGDDASTPILGFSTDEDMPSTVTDPSVKSWLESYSRQIAAIVSGKVSNKQTRPEWDAILQGVFPYSKLDVSPLLSTTWDQGCFYDAMCPADPSAGFSCNHTYTGCVATAMAQIMKYHNFPPQGVGSHSYVHPTYGTQSANFGATTYDWSSMPNNVINANPAVATIMYHAGVSVNMNYAPGGSGAYSEDVPGALLNYFNYQPDVTIKYLVNYPNVEDWKNLLRADLDQQLPIYYSGSGTEGHAWVCDGYRMSDGKFHFNWGWSGSSNGWYAIGNLNPGGYTFNDNNAVVLHIKPYNPNLIVRVSHPVNNAVIGVGYPVVIKANTVRGNPSGMKLYIDNVEVLSVTADSIQYTWSTLPSDLGSHLVKAVSLNATDTVYYPINVNVAEWISQASGFTTPSRGISYISAVDSNYAWASAMDNNNPTGACSDYTRTINGGNSWIPGTIPNTTGLASAMVFAMSGSTAYVAMYKVSGSKPQGIYMTADSGATWTRQTTASFSNSSSFPDCVHFFNTSEGWAMGDPINGEFEIYTTTNGGTTWTPVPGSAIANPLTGEFGVVGYYCAVNDTLWFGTNMSRVYRSTDKGYTWTVTAVPSFSSKYVKPTFRDGMHGLVQDKGPNSVGAVCETSDGGLTWTPVTITGPIYATDLSYVPDTKNTYVSSGSSGTLGCSYSFNGGHDWTDFIGTTGAPYMQMAWVNNHCGWAGGINTTATENGVYKFIGMLAPALPPPTNIIPVALGHSVQLTWTKPVYDSTELSLQGYNIYRDGLKLNAPPVVATSYTDNSVPAGQHTYCVRAWYTAGESAGDCDSVAVAVGIKDIPGDVVTIWPNPASDRVNLKSGSTITSIRVTDIYGKTVYRATGSMTNASLEVGSLPRGVYIMEIGMGEGTVTKKVVLQ